VVLSRVQCVRKLHTHPHGRVIRDVVVFGTHVGSVICRIILPIMPSQIIVQDFAACETVQNGMQSLLHVCKMVESFCLTYRIVPTVPDSHLSS
jgi:hypothetical protein